MKNILIVLALIIVAGGAYYYLTGSGSPASESAPSEAPGASGAAAVSVEPVRHASGVLSWGERAIYMDPVGEPALYEGRVAPDIVLLTHAHRDHLSTSTLAALAGADTMLIAPQTVADRLPEDLAASTTVMANGDTRELLGFTIEAVPMYNYPQGEDPNHAQGDGNGYILEREGTRVYVAGDTGPTPEMRALADIDIAFVPMNQPYTMTVAEAAEAVRAFAPDTVYPYHYRNRDDTLSDVGRFKELVEEGESGISVRLLDWYPGR